MKMKDHAFSCSTRSLSMFKDGVKTGCEPGMLIYEQALKIQEGEFLF